MGVGGTGGESPPPARREGADLRRSRRALELSMATGRTSAGVGVVVTITILGILVVTLFVLSMVFFGNMNRAQRELAGERQNTGDFVRVEEREDDRVRQYLQLARQEQQSVLGYLLREKRRAMETIGVTPDTTTQQLREQLAGRGVESGTLLQAVATRDRSIQDLERQLEEANAQRRAAQEDAAAAAERVAGVDEQFRRTVAQLRGEVDLLNEQLEVYRSQVGETEQTLTQRLEARLAEAQDEENRLLDQIRELRDQLAVARDQLANQAGENVGAIQGRPEESLVDARVIGLNPTANEVFLDIGREHKVPLGLRFRVYSTPEQIRPDLNTGEYPQGKGVIEVTRIEGNTVRARIIEEARGNPIVRNDVVANAVYDPNKTYRFLVYGNFDVNQDGIATASEAGQIEALIREWGGELTNDVDGRLDFIVLGEKPNLPPPPPAGAPVEVLNEYIRLQRIAQRYDELFQIARQTAIPVLNENRLRTLVGGFDR